MSQNKTLHPFFKDIKDDLGLGYEITELGFFDQDSLKLSWMGGGGIKIEIFDHEYDIKVYAHFLSNDRDYQNFETYQIQSGDYYYVMGAEYVEEGFDPGYHHSKDLVEDTKKVAFDIYKNSLWLREKMIGEKDHNLKELEEFREEKENGNIRTLSREEELAKEVFALETKIKSQGDEEKYELLRGFINKTTWN